MLLCNISTPHLCQVGGNYFSILLSPPQPSCFPSHPPFFVILFSSSYSSLLFIRLLEARSTKNHNLHHQRVPPPPPLLASYLAHIIKLHMPLLFLLFYRRSLPSQHFWLSFVGPFCSTKNFKPGSKPQQYMIFMVLYTTAPDNVFSIFTFVNLPLTLT